jgi:hypothetical protein
VRRPKLGQAAEACSKREPTWQRRKNPINDSERLLTAPSEGNAMPVLLR